MFENAPESVDLSEPSLYINRELSLLEFNRRVLAQSMDVAVPLLERLRFLAIFSSNLDEFFEVRVAGLKREVEIDVGPATFDGRSPQEILRQISRVAHDLVDAQYQQLNEILLPALDAEGVRVLRRSVWTPHQRDWTEQYFREQCLPVLTPVGLDPAHPFPNVQNKGLSFIVSLEGDDAFGRDSGVAVVQVPRSLPRVIEFPPEVTQVKQEFAMISSVIHAHVGQLFPNMTVTGCHQFRVTRNSDLWVDEERSDDLLSALQGELHGRPYGAAVRLEVADNCSEPTVRFLLDQFDLDEGDRYQVKGPVNLHRLAKMIPLVDRPDLKYRPFVPGLPRHVGSQADLFATLRHGDVLLHHPFQSFAPVVELMRQAAADPAVLAIKQTLYRTDADSPIVDALIAACRAGKDVTAVVELRARFDEAANIRLATRLQSAGANVAYGVVGYKCHAKMLMIVRREGSHLRRYVHLGTGNYHTRTARLYTDVSFMTCREDIGEDMHSLFLQLTGLGRVERFSKLLHAPFTLHDALMRMIATEASAARAGRPARILARMNSLSERKLIRALYVASQAGVEIDLIVRGVCRLRPGIPGVSENIRVRSIVGRFLEHSRVFCFHAAGADRVLCASADWMSRNTFWRVETCFPVEDPDLARRVRQECLEAYVQDNCQAWVLTSDGNYTRQSPGAAEPYSAQRALMASLGAFDD